MIYEPAIVYLGEQAYKKYCETMKDQIEWGELPNMNRSAWIDAALLVYNMAKLKYENAHIDLQFLYVSK